MDDLDHFDLTRPATAARPLLGLTVLLVEDSRFASDAMRLLCLRSGARIRRADSLHSAGRHLQVYRPSVAIVDLGLPDGSGAELIGELVRATPRVGIVLGISGDPSGEAAARAAGADGFLEKPVTRLAIFQEAILSRLPEDRRPEGPRLVEEEKVRPDPLAYADDMAHAAELLTEGQPEAELDYIAQFLHSVGQSAGDQPLLDEVEALSRARLQGRPVRSELARVAGLIQARLAQAEPI
ncbi:response regulator [Aquicoccus sp. SCR17]|nr:response regulator [Carideicomes alvinocaridis]